MSDVIRQRDLGNETTLPGPNPTVVIDALTTGREAAQECADAADGRCDNADLKYWNDRLVEIDKVIDMLSKVENKESELEVELQTLKTRLKWFEDSIIIGDHH